MKKLARILILNIVLLSLFVSTAEAANFFLVPASSTVYIGSTLYIYLKVNSTEMASNSYSAVVNYDGNYFDPVSVLKSGSICTLFVVEPTMGTNSANITCGLPSPGYQGASGNIVILNLRAKKVGTTYLGVSSGAILANDGFGTNILRSSNGTSVRIIATAPPPPEEETVEIVAPIITADKGENGDWLAETEIKFSWDTPKNAEGFSYSFSTDKNKNPEEKNMTSDTSKIFKDLADGVYYFKVMGVNGSSFGEIATYTIRIDNTGPEKFDVIIDPDTDEILTTRPLIGFAAVDNGSGVAKYQISIDGGDFVDVTNPYIFTQITGGNHSVALRAYDQVGNFTEKELAFAIVEIEAPIITSPIQSEIIQSSNGLTIKGTATPDSSVLIYIDGELVGTAQTDHEGNFILSIAETLPAGEHTITAQIKNEGGILSVMSEAITINIEESLLPVNALSELPGESWYYICGGLLCLLIPLILLLLFLFYKRKKKNEDENDKVENKVEKSINPPDKDPEISSKQSNSSSTTVSPPSTEKPITAAEVTTAAAIGATIATEMSSTSVPQESLTPMPKPESEEKEREIERRLSETRLQIDQEMHTLERKIREEIENDPNHVAGSEHQLEHVVSDAIAESEDKIEAMLDPSSIVDGENETTIQSNPTESNSELNPAPISVKTPLQPNSTPSPAEPSPILEPTPITKDHNQQEKLTPTPTEANNNLDINSIPENPNNRYRRSMGDIKKPSRESTNI